MNPKLTTALLTSNNLSVNRKVQLPSLLKLTLLSNDNLFKEQFRNSRDIFLKKHFYKKTRILTRLTTPKSYNSPARIRYKDMLNRLFLKNRLTFSLSEDLRGNNQFYQYLLPTRLNRKYIKILKLKDSQDDEKPKNLYYNSLKMLQRKSARKF